MQDLSWVEAWLQEIRENEEEGLRERANEVEVDAREYSSG